MNADLNEKKQEKQTVQNKLKTIKKPFSVFGSMDRDKSLRYREELANRVREAFSEK
jgi:hypothetical protein